MASSYQKAAQRRKLLYFGLIIGLLVVTVFVRGVIAVPVDRFKDGAGRWTIQSQSDRLDLNEMSQGDVELTGSAIRLLLTGSRGLAICGLWISANEKQRVQEWNELELTVRSITKLQPHFVTPWLFQSWNLSYNVSAEMDRLNDKYFYIARGISLLADGEAINRNNPDIRYAIANYYQNKFTVSDQVTTLRCLFQLSCMPKEERDYRTLLRGGQVDPEAFKAFCEKSPQLVRRLRESAIRPGKAADGSDLPLIYLAESPREVVQFLRDNEVLPNRFRDDSPKVLEDRLKQFPVLPPPFYRQAEEEMNPERPIGDGEASGVRAARVWFRYANEVIPPPDSEPSFSPINYRDPERKRRLPGRPMLIIFRQGPMRAQSYIAEQTAKDGWIGRDPWIVDRQQDSNSRWFREDVRIKPTTNSQEEWEVAHRMWDEHGRANGLLFDQNELYQKYGRRSELYARKRGFNYELLDLPQPRADEQSDQAMADSIEANRRLVIYKKNLQFTNYRFFLYQAEFEKDPDTIRARILLAEADRLRRRDENRDALAVYEQAFGTQEKPGLWAKLLLKRNIRAVDSRLFERMSEETYEHQLDFQRLARQYYQKEMRQTTVALWDVLRFASPASQISPYYFAFNDLLMQDRLWQALRSDDVPAFWPPGPFDGFDPDGKRWIPEEIVERVKQNTGINKQASK